MSKYRVPVVWSMWGHVEVEAKSEEEAIKIALDWETPLPDGVYVDDSIMVDDITAIEIV